MKKEQVSTPDDVADETTRGAAIKNLVAVAQPEADGKKHVYTVQDRVAYTKTDKPDRILVQDLSRPDEPAREFVIIE